MRRNTFVELSFLAFGLLPFSFVLTGLSRLVVPVEMARLLSAPTMLAGGALVVVLAGRSLAAVAGLRPLEE